MADMVTLDENELYGQRDKIKKWDLMDMTKRDAWLITLYAALRKDENAYAAVMRGPPTIAMMQKRDPSATVTRAQGQVDALMDEWQTANQRAYRIIAPRIDFEKRAGLAAKVLREIEPAQNGLSLMQIINDAIDFSSISKQEDARRDLKDFRLGVSLPTPELLHDRLDAYGAVWSRIEGNDINEPKQLIQKALRLLPRHESIKELASYAGMLKALLDVTAGNPTTRCRGG